MACTRESKGLPLMAMASSISSFPAVAAGPGQTCTSGKLTGRDQEGSSRCSQKSRLHLLRVEPARHPTWGQDPAELPRAIREVTAPSSAAGIDPKVFFERTSCSTQSQVPRAWADFAWGLQLRPPRMGWLKTE